MQKYFLVMFYSCSQSVIFSQSLLCCCFSEIDECSEEPCLNGGNCTDGVNNFTCNCTGTGYSGDLCECGKHQH